MILRKAQVAVVAVVLGTSGIAFAQVPGEVLKQQIATTDQARHARRVIAGGAQCLLSDRPSNVRAFLKMFPASKDAARSATYLNQGDCVDGSSGGQQMNFGATMLRGAIYKAMYIEDFSGKVPLLGTALDYAVDSRGQDPGVAKEYVADRRFAECVIKAKPDLSRAYVLAAPEEQAEFDALTALQPTIEDCRQADQTGDFTRSKVSNLVSEVLYRMTKSEKGTNA